MRSKNLSSNHSNHARPFDLRLPGHHLYDQWIAYQFHSGLPGDRKNQTCSTTADCWSTHTGWRNRLTNHDQPKA